MHRVWLDSGVPVLWLLTTGSMWPFLYLRGSILDYEVKLMQHGFKFRNPNEKAGCGCGESFTV